MLPILPFSLSSFACPKEETRKRHPSQSWPCGLPLLLAEGGTRKNSGFALKQFPRLFPPPSARRGRTNGGGRELTLARSRAPERLPKLFDKQIKKSRHARFGWRRSNIKILLADYLTPPAFFLAGV
jgi:hypothetical protein